MSDATPVTPDGGPRKGALGVVFLTVVIDLMGFGLMMPLIPLIARDYGATDAVAGLLLATYSFMQLFCAPLLGRLSDKIGRRPVILLGLLGSCASYALFGIAGSLTARFGAEVSLTLLFVARALAGAFGATVQTAQAYVADVTTPETRARGMGMIGAAFGIGYLIGPAIGGLLAEWRDSAPAFFASGLSLTAFGFGYSRLVESRPRDARRTPIATERGGALRVAFSDARRALLLVLFFALVYAFANFESRFTPFGVDVMDFDKSSTSWLVALVSLFVALVQGGMIHRLVKRVGERPLFAMGTILFGAGYFALAASDRGSPALFFLACALIGLGQGFASPTLSAMISKCTPAERQGAVFGIQQSMSSLARVVGHALSGRIYMRSVALPFWISGALLVVVTIVFLAARPLKGAFGRPATKPEAGS